MKYTNKKLYSRNDCQSRERRAVVFWSWRGTICVSYELPQSSQDNSANQRDMR